MLAARRAIGSFNRLPLRSRIAVLTAAVVGVAIALSALAAYVTVRWSLLQQTDSALLERARGAVVSLRDPSVLAELPAEAFGAADIRVAYLRRDGLVQSARGAASAPPLGEPELAVARGRAGHSVRTATADGFRARVVAVPAEPGFALVLAQPTAPTEATLERLGWISFVVGALGVAVAAWAGWAVARAGLRPVERLTLAAENVARTGDLTAIPVRGDDELARLTASFNAMLAALAESRDRQRRLVADAGHELRTPLTSLRTNLDLLAQSERIGGMPPQERAALLSDVRAQTAELTTLVADLMELSRDSEPATESAPLDLSEVVRDAVARARRRAPGIAFSVELHPWPMQGDRQQLSRAVINLLDNAAKWSPPHGTVDVVLRSGELTVTDEGPGIRPEDRSRVFERFWRAPEARALPGSGLGLSIVAQAAARHGGSVVIQDGPRGGAAVTLRLPGTESA